MKSKIIIILVLVVAFSLLLTGCFPGKIREEITEDFGEKIKENVTDKIAEAVEDAKIDVDVDDDGITIESEDGKLEISGGDDAHWPEDAPDIIPEWNKPLVSSVITKDSLIVGSKDIKVD
ncbi:MAG: hypothetical protein KAQ68_09440, partial [Clostridiales bacterium]|nr:hypothetical protein [Clostridiales bacterium]